MVGGQHSTGSRRVTLTPAQGVSAGAPSANQTRQAALPPRTEAHLTAMAGAESWVLGSKHRKGPHQTVLGPHEHQAARCARSDHEGGPLDT